MLLAHMIYLSQNFASANVDLQTAITRETYCAHCGWAATPSKFVWLYNIDKYETVRMITVRVGVEQYL